MSIWYNEATKKKERDTRLPALLYGLCIVHSPNFLHRKNFQKFLKLLLT